MKIYQVAVGIQPGDGVSNCILSLDDSFKRLGFESRIVVNGSSFNNNADMNIKIVSSFGGICVSADDVVLYHYYSAAEAIRDVEGMQCKKILVFHNVSTPSLFRDVSWPIYRELALGTEDAKQTYLHFDRAIALSEYSKANLIDYGWQADKVEVVPIISMSQFICTASEQLLLKYSGEVKNFLFVGRISPNKKIEDVIRVFSYYQKNIDKNIRLFLVGNIQFQNYYDALLEYIEEEKIENIVFTGGVLQEDLEAYYRLADVFVCMSEHEGFCIPIMEAFSRGVPVVAFSSTAVPNTMGNAGILLDTKDPKEVSKRIERLFADKEYNNRVIGLQRQRADSFQITAFEKTMIRIIKSVKNEKPKKCFSEQFSDIMRHHPQVVADEALEKPFVIYGYGKAGKQLEKHLTAGQRKNLVAICDNGGSEETITHEECVKEYKDVNIILTMQFGYVGVVSDLIRDGVDKNQIYHYQLSRNEICR